MGLVVRVRAARPAGRHQFAHRDLPVAIDLRIELFPVEVWDAYERVVAGVDGWQAQLDDWGVTIVVAAGDEEDAFRPGS